jgi:RNA polymerase sigma factor (TIGR02999 family)
MTPSGDEPTSAHMVTNLLIQWGKGDRAAFNELMPLVYRELHKMAKRYMRQQESGHTLQTTAVIHEAYLKLAGGTEQDLENRAHFYGVAAKAMRHILVDHARTRQSVKRGGKTPMVTLDEGLPVVDTPAAEILALDDALNALAASYPRQAEVVELRYFGGLSVDEVSRKLKVSPETVARDWRFAKSFLRRETKHGARG